MNRILPLIAIVALFSAPTYSQTGSQAATSPVPVGETVVKIPLEPGISLDQAVESMKIRANSLNMKLVAELPLSKQVEAMGQKSRRMEIFQFCDPLTAKKMVEHNVDFAAYLPCRISLVEDAKGQGWLVMMKLDPLIEGGNLSGELKQEAIKVRDTLNDIMQAGVRGEW